MDANSKKVMEKSEKNFGAATKESLEGTNEAATIEESSGRSKEAPKSVAATIEESSGGTKEIPKSVATTIEESCGGTEEAPKSMVATIEESPGGTKEEPQKLTVKPLKEIVPKNTTPGNEVLKAEPKAKSEVDVELKAGTSAKPKSKDENSSGKMELATTSATGLKRTRDNSFEKKEGQDTNENFEEKSRQKVQTMTRQELEDLAVQKIFEEKKANREVKRIRTQLMKTEDIGSMCPKCKTTVRPARPVYASTVTKEKGQGSRGSNQSGRSGGKAGQSQSGPVRK